MGLLLLSLLSLVQLPDIFALNVRVSMMASHLDQELAFEVTVLGRGPDWGEFVDFGIVRISAVLK